MDTGAFKAAIYELSLYFERKPPGDETIRQWCDEIRDVNGKYLPALVSMAKKLESWPRNLPAWMSIRATEMQEKDGGGGQYRIHPRRFYPGKYAKPNCPKCHGRGLYDFPMDWPVRKEQGRIITKRVVKPALCDCSEEAEYGF